MKMQVFSVGLLLLFSVIGCAMLQEAPLVEIPASRLTCNQNPEMVDGDLKTVGTFCSTRIHQKRVCKNSIVRASAVPASSRRYPQNRNAD